MKNLRIWPSYFQGFLAGCVILASRFIIYLSHNWDFTIVPAYTLLTGLVMIVGIVMGVMADRKDFENAGTASVLSHENEIETTTSVLLGTPFFGFWQAFASTLRVIVVAIFLVEIADLTLMIFIDSTLIEQTKSLKIDQVKQSLMVFNVDNETIDLSIKQIRDQNYRTPTFWLADWMNKVISNAFVGLVVAAFMRRKRQTHWVDQA